jgi:hypothetical protein
MPGLRTVCVGWTPRSETSRVGRAGPTFLTLHFLPPAKMWLARQKSWPWSGRAYGKRDPAQWRASGSLPCPRRKAGVAVNF